MKPQELLFWVAVGISISILILFFTNELLANMIDATVTVEM